MNAKILQFVRTCPKPREVVSSAEGHAHAGVEYAAAWWIFWFNVWGIK